MIRTPSTVWTEEKMLGLRYLLSAKQVSRVYRAAGCPDPEYREVWRSLTPGERTYLLVFWSATRLRFTNKLVALCGGDRAKALAIREDLRKDNKMTERGLLTATPAQREEDARNRAKRREDRGTPENAPYRSPRFNRNDVPAEALNRDLEPMLGPAKSDPVWLPEYDRPPAPVRKVSIEEYEATKQRPKKGDKNLSFLPKVNSGSADKMYEGLMEDEVFSQEHQDYRRDMAGYDDPRHEDGPYNPRYSAE